MQYRDKHLKHKDINPILDFLSDQPSDNKLVDCFS